MPRREAAALVDTVIELIAEHLEAGEAVNISSFNSFGLRDKSEREGRNPKTLEAVPILPRRVVTFRASGVLKADPPPWNWSTLRLWERSTKPC